MFRMLDADCPPTLPGVDDTQPWIHTTRNGHGGQVAVSTKNLQPTGGCLGILSEIYRVCTYDQIIKRVYAKNTIGLVNPQDQLVASCSMRNCDEMLNQPAPSLMHACQ